MTASAAPAGDPPPVLPPGWLSYRCNVCGAAQARDADTLSRAAPSCDGCGSTGRWRAVVETLARELFDAPLALDDFPRRPDLRGLGLSDWPRYADVLEARLGYRNTSLHQEPRFDLLDPDPALLGRLDFLIASDVFEHIDPPIERAFANARRLLRPGGVLILTVPYRLDGETKEHFPELHDYRLVERAGRYRLENVTRDGRRQTFDDLTFHDGYGHTLELRIFSLPSLRAQLRDAGFAAVRLYDRPSFAHGICWPGGVSFPIAAR